MIWKLISYSEAKFPLPPFKTNYAVGIIENENGDKLIAQIDQKSIKEISIGVTGEIKQIKINNEKVNLFFQDNSEIEPEITKVALITGSIRGIGKAIAIKLAKEGMNIIINNSKNDSDGLNLVEEIKQLGRQAIYIPTDVSDYTKVEKMVNEIIIKFGRIDILVNNAGITRDKKLENMDLKLWDEVIAVNLTGTFNCTKAIIKHMQDKGGGKIINISSIVGQMGNFGQANYSSSKGGIISLTKTIAKEYAGDRILVNAIAPGFIKTDMLGGIPKGIMTKILEQIPLGRLGEPEEVAELVSFLASDRANFITGQIFNINGGQLM